MSEPADIQKDAGAGLSTTEARQRLAEYGPNEPVSARPTGGSGGRELTGYSCQVPI
jgi:hypothetical protein